jgi:hypothetical protein
MASPTPADLELVRKTLTPAQAGLFSQLQPSEQAHAVRVLRAVQENCHRQGLELPEYLQVSDLLHDIGKACYPLRIWERVMIVLGGAIFPNATTRWGERSPRGWARPFVVAAQHPAWGAEMAAGQGTSSRAVALIRRHQDPLPSQVSNKDMNEEDQLLAILQAVDGES